MVFDMITEWWKIVVATFSLTIVFCIVWLSISKSDDGLDILLDTFMKRWEIPTSFHEGPIQDILNGMLSEGSLF